MDDGRKHQVAYYRTELFIASDTFYEMAVFVVVVVAEMYFFFFMDYKLQPTELGHIAKNKWKGPLKKCKRFCVLKRWRTSFDSGIDSKMKFDIRFVY